MLEPTQFRAKPAGARASPSDPTSQPDSRATSDLQRLLDRRRRDCAAGVCELRHREDYEQLDRLGISVKGAIVIARYGARLARHQAQGRRRARSRRLHHLFGSRGRRLFQGDDFRRPDAPREGVQRGSVMDYRLSRRSADARGRRHPGRQAAVDQGSKTITKIPVLPISYGDAQPLLSALQGPVAPEAWRGALPITYHIGPGPAKVHLKVASNWDIKTALRRHRHDSRRGCPSNG